jgi:transposase-like protein
MKSRRKFSGAFKAKVALESLKEQSSHSELREKYQLGSSQIPKWKREFLEKSALVFELETPEKQAVKEVKKLYEKIGRLRGGTLCRIA